MRKKENILFGLILLFLFTLFYPKPAILTIVAVVALILYSFYFSSVKDKWKVLKESRPLQGMLLFFALVVASVFMSSDLDKAFNFLDSRLALFYLPLTIGTLRLTKDFRNKILLGIALLTTAIMLFCLAYGLQRSGWLQQPELLYNDSFTEVLTQQSIYISLLVNIALYILAYFIFFRPIKYKGGLVVAVIFLFGISYLLASRIMMGVLYTSVIGFCFYFIWQQKKYLLGFALLAGMGISLFLTLLFFPQTLNRFKELTYTEYSYGSMARESHFNMEVTPDQWNGANFRMAAWRCGWELFKQHPLLGVNIGDKKDKLFDVYRQKDFQFAIQGNKNVHNNYLDILYSMGLIGLSIFLLGWIILPIAAAFKHKDGLALITIITFAAAWITEIYFDRNLGGMLTGFFIPFMLTAYNNKARSGTIAEHT